MEVWETALRAAALPIGVGLYAILFAWLAKRESARISSGEASAGQKLRDKAYLLGRKLGRKLSGERVSGGHLVADAVLKRPTDSK